MLKIQFIPIPKSIPILDGIRGGLAFWVLLSHIIQLTDGPKNFLSKGGVAVDLFMFISGFLMLWNVRLREEKEPSQKISTWYKFIARRFFRIAPLYYFALIPAYLFFSTFQTLHQEVYTYINKPLDRPFLSCAPNAAVDIVSHITFAYGIFPCTSSTNILPDWSLSLEMQFYALFPILYLLFTKKHRLLISAIAIFIVGIFSNLIGVFDHTNYTVISYPQPSIILIRINCFIVGMILAEIMMSQSLRLADVFLLVVTSIIFQRLTFAFLALAISTYLIANRFAAPTIPSFQKNIFAKLDVLFENTFMKWIGDISYGVYLMHFLILLPIIHWMHKTGSISSLDGWEKVLVASAFSIPPIFFMAHLSHIYIEKPFIEIGRKLILKIK